VFSQRYERGSTIVISNLPFDEWTSVFASERLTGALLGRNAALQGVRGIGENFASVLVREVFYRSFANRRQVASYVGIAPMPYQSGGLDRDRSISRAGNPRARTTLIQLAWLRLRYQLAWCTDQRCVRNDPNPCLGSDDADIARASQLQHAVEDMDRHVHFSHPTFVHT